MRIKKNVLLSLVLIIALNVGTPSLAAGPSIDSPTSSPIICSRFAYFSNTSGATYDIIFSITAYGLCTNIGASEIKVYAAWDGALLRTYLPSSYPSMLSHNTSTYGSSVSFTGIVGKSYYAVVTVYAENSTVSDSKTMTIYT